MSMIVLVVLLTTKLHRLSNSEFTVGRQHF